MLWPERLSPRVSVATLRLLAAEFDSPAQMAFAKRLSYNPWHTIAEHRPLGNQSRARRRMYAELSRLRQSMNPCRISSRLGTRSSSEHDDSAVELHDPGADRSARARRNCAAARIDERRAGPAEAGQPAGAVRGSSTPCTSPRCSSSTTRRPRTAASTESAAADVSAATLALVGDVDGDADAFSRSWRGARRRDCGRCFPAAKGFAAGATSSPGCGGTPASRRRELRELARAHGRPASARRRRCATLVTAHRDSRGRLEGSAAPRGPRAVASNA